MTKDSKILLQDFCDLQGVNESDKFVLSKKFKTDEKYTYHQWLSKTSDFGFEDKKLFTNLSKNKTS